MLKRRCSGCGEKVERKFNYCPWCGIGFKTKNEQENFGMIGKDDFVDGNLKGIGTELWRC